MGVMALVLFASCAGFVEPAVPYAEFTTGVYLRTTERRAATINFFDLGNAKFEIVVEAVGANNGEGLVDKVEVFTRRRRGPALTQYTTLTTIPGSAFGAYPGTRNFPRAPNRTYPAALISIPLSQALQAMNFTVADIEGGDFVEFRLVLTTTDGVVFSDNNISADIATGSFYDSPFFYRVPVICPSDLEGTYSFSTVNVTAGEGGNAGACAPAKTGSVTIARTTVGGEYTLSDASFGVFDCAFAETPPGGSIRFTDACGKIGMKGSDKYGDSYSLTYISHNATELTFAWINTFGDGGTTTLTRASGSWPTGLK